MVALSNYVFQTWNETFDYLLKTEVDGDPQLLQPGYQEIEENIEKLESDVRNSFKYFTCDADKSWWNFFFNHYDDTGMWTVMLLNTFKGRMLALKNNNIYQLYLQLHIPHGPCKK